MKKQFKLINLECASCAAKIESAIKKIDGVESAAISFMTQKLTIDADEGRFESIMDKVASICKRLEPDCKVMR